MTGATLTGPWGDRPWHRAAVYGLGASGRAAAALLQRRGVAVLAVDDRPAAELDLDGLTRGPGLEVVAGGLDELPADVDGVVLSPGVPPDRPALQAARAAGLPVIAEVELAFPLLDGPVVGITGSNGKSTTTALVGELLAASGRDAVVCGNIGVPLSSVVDGPAGRVFVVELSSFQLEAVDAFRPVAAALLNLSPDHLDRYPDLESYGAAKARLFARQQDGDVAVLNVDDPWVAALEVPSRRRLFSLRQPVADGARLEGETVVEATPDGGARPLFAHRDLRLPGPQNVENAMAAALLALAVGGRREVFPEALRGFAGLPHRTQWVGEWKGVAWYDDSKGTNPGATLRALSGFPDGRVHLILGGRDKGTGLGPELVELVARKARAVYLVGEAAPGFASELGDRVAVRRSGGMETAVAEIRAAAGPGDVALLSPACASFDQYGGYAERGEHFQRLARRREAS